jgi:hypothetical protein
MEKKKKKKYLKGWGGNIRIFKLALTLGDNCVYQSTVYQLKAVQEHAMTCSGQ